MALLAVATLTACQPQLNPPPNQSMFILNGIKMVENPPYMNDGNLAILRDWYNHTHNPVTATTLDGSSRDLLSVTTTEPMPLNVVWARKAWFDTDENPPLQDPGQVVGDPGAVRNTLCAFGVLFGGAAAVFLAADPPATLGATIIAWTLQLGPDALTLADCIDTFTAHVEDAVGFRWFHYCRDSYLTADDYNMLDPAWVPADAVKFQECVTYGWTAWRAAQNGAHVDAYGNAFLEGIVVCNNDIVFPRCVWT